MPTIDYLPIANGGGANVESQAQYVIDLAGGGSLEHGYEAGLAKSVQFNKTMRQSSMITAAVATFISNALGISVLDDGVLSTLVTNLTNAVRSANQAGQCRLSATGTTTIKLSPYNGNHLTINGVSQAIPAAGVTMTNSGTVPSAFYYIYAYMSAGVMTLENSATGHSTDVATAGNIGVEIKTGDPTRTLVGAVVTDGASHFIAPTSGGIINWFNRQNITISAQVASVVFTNNSLAELTTGLRVPFITWAGESVFAISDGSAYSDTTAGSLSFQSKFNFVPAVGDGSLCSFTDWSASNGMAFSSSNSLALTEGLNYFTLFGNCSALTTGTIIQGYTRVNVRG